VFTPILSKGTYGRSREPAQRPPRTREEMAVSGMDEALMAPSMTDAPTVLVVAPTLGVAAKNDVLGVAIECDGQGWASGSASLPAG